MPANGRLRILHIVGDSKWGGGAVVLEGIVTAARDLNWEVDILATDPGVQAWASGLGLGVVNLDAIWRDIRPVRDLRGLLKLRRFLGNAGYDLVHTHTSKAGFVGRIAAFLAGVPLIVHTVHGFAFHEQSSRRKILFHAALEKMAGKCCNRIVTVSHFHRGWALRLGLGDPARVTAIPNGISDERVHPSNPAAPRERNADGAVRIASIGRLAPEKGLEELIEAVALLRNRGHVVRLLIAGDGPLRQSLERQAYNAGIEAEFPGFREDIGRLLVEADLVALPSFREGLSITLLEAMAAGKPIVASNIGSNREATACGYAATLVPPGDVPALAQAIEEMINDPELCATLGERARMRYLEAYTDRVMIQGYEDLYAQLVREKGIRLTLACL